MKTISLKFEQVKKGKNGTTLVSLRSKVQEFDSKAKAEEIVLNQVQQLSDNLKFAAQIGAKSVSVGGVNFSLKGKFYLYVTIDGQDYSTDDINMFWEADKTKLSFSNVGAFVGALYGVLRIAEGKSPLYTQQAIKTLGTSVNTKLIGGH